MKTRSSHYIYQMLLYIWYEIYTSFFLYLLLHHNLEFVLSGSLALADDLKAKPLSEEKRDLDKESMLEVCSIFLSYFSVCWGVLPSEHYLWITQSFSRFYFYHFWVIDRELITRPENRICALFFNIFPKEKEILKKECSINLKIQIILNFKGF